MSASNLIINPNPIVDHCNYDGFRVPEPEYRSDPTTRTTPLVEFLQTLQQTALDTFGPSGYDPKSYVDLSLKPGRDLPSVRLAFEGLLSSSSGSVSAVGLREFLGEFFEGPGEDLVRDEAGDFAAEPEGFLVEVRNKEVRDWALEVHRLWRSLCRRVAGDVLDRPESHTLLPMTNRVIVPGSRFREVYYWDSYWIIRGLLVSKMYETAKAIVSNLISMVEQYGYVLNGARTYYTNRSQPPLLSAMVCEIYKRTNDMELVKKSLPALIKEHEFWNSEIHGVTIKSGQGCDFTLSRYYAMWNKPRPESSTIDKESASKITSPSKKKQFYREVASAAESGWDFSTRWMTDPKDLTTLATTSVLPVDLNSFILGMELNIAFLGQVIGDQKIVQRYSEAAKTRKKAIESIFWNEEMRQWLDYSLKDCKTKEGEKAWEAGNQNQNIFASNFIPLWIESFHSDTSLVNKVMTSLQSSGLLCDYGIATSLTNSGQQWDYPNGWAPIQHMIIEGLGRSGSKEARSMAEDIAIRWIKTNYVAFKRTRTMHEKYNVEKCGDFGGGGEYVPQTGFGWSNGVVFALLEEFGWPEDRNIEF